MLTVSSATRLFGTPRVFFTLAGNPLSEEALGFVKKRLKPVNGSNIDAVSVKVFSDEAAVKAYFEQGISPLSAVVLFDSPYRVGRGRQGKGKRYQHLARNRPEDNGRIPRWARGAQWAVVLYSEYESIGHQLVALYVKKFEDQLEREHFPWGCPRRGERVPGKVDLPDRRKEAI